MSINVKKIPVYKVTYDFLLFVYRNTNRVQRAYRYSLVEELKRSIQDLGVEIIHAHMCDTDKIKYIEQARLCLERTILFTRMMRDLKQFSPRQSAVVAEYQVEICRQLDAWRRYLKGGGGSSGGSKVSKVRSEGALSMTSVSGEDRSSPSLFDF